MRRKMSNLAVCCLAAGVLLAGMNAGATFAAETEAAETELMETEAEETQAAETEEGQMAFAQCEEYINIRSGADTGSEIVAKIYNNGHATILGQEGDWYKIQSGNAVGYVKAEYFVTGAEAEAIAGQVAYNVATVYPDTLMIRSEASETSEAIGAAYSSEQLEVVDYTGDWMKVALGNDVYGYVNAYYVGYETYYPTAVTLEEEQAKLEAQQAAAQYQDSGHEEQADYSEYTEAQAAADAAVQNQAEAEAAAQAAAEAAAQAQAEAEAAAQAQAEAEAQAAAAQNQAEAEAAAQAAAEAAAQAQAEAEAAAQAQAEAEAQAAAEAEAAAQAAAEAEAARLQAEAEAAAKAETEAAGNGGEETSGSGEEAGGGEENGGGEEAGGSTGYSLGQQIVDYATQFIGNPYVYGGTSLTNGADCSGFTQSVFANFGISLPRVAADQAYGGTSVDLGSIQAGDLLFYSDGSGISHVAIYMGNGSIVHASNPSTGITTASYNYSTPVCAARYW